MGSLLAELRDSEPWERLGHTVLPDNPPLSPITQATLCPQSTHTLSHKHTFTHTHTWNTSSCAIIHFPLLSISHSIPPLYVAPSLAIPPFPSRSPSLFFSVFVFEQLKLFSCSWPSALSDQVEGRRGLLAYLGLIHREHCVWEERGREKRERERAKTGAYRRKGFRAVDIRNGNSFMFSWVVLTKGT